MAWKGVITNAGDALLKKWPSGGVLELCRAAAGTGRVEEALLMAQTSLVNEKQEMGILSTIQTDDGPRLKLRLNVPEEGFALSQYGVWAKLDGGEAVLLAIYQNDADIPIPSVSEEPDFEYVMYATICFTNLGELTVTIEPSTVVSKEDMDEYVEDYVAKALAPVQEKLDDHVKTVSGNPHKVTAEEVGADPAGSAAGVAANLNAHTARTDNPHGVTAAQAGASPVGHKHAAADITSGTLPVARGGTGAATAAAALTALGGVPTTRKVNGKALSADITLGAADVGAAATNHGTHVTYSAAAPKGAGTASAGTAATVARSDHVHPAQTSVTGSSGSCTGNAATANALVGPNSTLSVAPTGNCAYVHALNTATGQTMDIYAPGGLPTFHNYGGGLVDTNYPVPRTDGANASGTWPINITGSAGSAGVAGSCTGNAATATNATNHINNKNNPHGVTLSQLGAAAASHTHDVSQITGALKFVRGTYTGTGTYGQTNYNTIYTGLKRIHFIVINQSEGYIEAGAYDQTLGIIISNSVAVGPNLNPDWGYLIGFSLNKDSTTTARLRGSIYKYSETPSMYAVSWFGASAKQQLNDKIKYTWYAYGEA